MKILYLGLMIAGLTARGADTAVLRNGTPQEQAAAAQALGYAKDSSAVQVLSTASLDADPAVARAAAEALGAIGTEQAAEALLQVWPRSTVPALLANGVLRCAEARREAKDSGRARLLYDACREKGSAAQQAAALIGLASLEPQPPVAAKPSVLEALRNESEEVRLTGIHAAVRAADAAVLPVLFVLSMKPGEEGRAATLAMAAMAAQETDAFLYGEMKKVGPERAKAIELLAERGQKDLARRLCDPTLYASEGVSSAVGGAWRVCLGQEDFGGALAFAFGLLPAPQREPLVSALASVAQQLPDQKRVIREMGEQLGQTEAASKVALLGLLAGMQTEDARDVLVAQAKTDDVELRKAVVRVLSKWSSPLAVAPLQAFARKDAERSVKILATRGLLALVQRSGAVAKSEKLALLAELAAVAERAEEKKAIYECVKTEGGKEAAALSKQLAEACGIEEKNERVIKAVNAGGPAVGVFAAESGFTGGKKYAVKLEADVSDTVDEAPEEVYQTCRFGDDLAMLFEGLQAGRTYVLRLHFAEPYFDQPARMCDVLVNGKAVLTDYDIIVKTGRKMKAVTERAEVTADAAGRIEVVFKTKRDHALVSGLELLERVGPGTSAGAVTSGKQKADVKSAELPAAAVATIPRPAGKSGQLNILLLAGANNHNWQETTAALKAIFAESPKFAVTGVENPWDMKPLDLQGYDLIFNNWNTFGKDKRAWTAEMKAAFMAWVKKGGGFFVLHAGGSMFYDWDDFQRLTGGAWEKETFHPHRQAFIVNIADKEHPVTRGMKDFETFDEPWQKTGNRNPNRRVLLTGVVTQENKGSGEPEPFAWVTEMGQGRCFNLVLGHDVRALSSAGCKTLILRGSEWAATGCVK